MAQRVKVLATNPGDLTLVNRTQRWKKRIDSHKLSSNLHTCVVSTHMYAHIYKFTNIKK